MNKLFSLLFKTAQILGFSSVFANDFNKRTEDIQSIKSALDMASGTSYAVIKNDQIIYEGYLGYADIENQRKVTKDTKFYIASTTKAIFSLATLLAESKGDLAETTNLIELFPNIKFNNFDAEKITVNHLLTHRSGIDNEAFTWAGSWTGIHDKELRDEFIATLYPHKSKKIGEFEYTNLGYNVMSVWFEKYYQKDWRETVSEFVLKPLGMKSTSGYMSDIEKFGWEFAEPYSYKYKSGNEKVYLRKDDKTMYSIGMVSNVSDVAKFVIAELNHGKYMGKQVFPSEVILKSQKKQADNYSWGWQTSIYEGQEERYHTGGFVGTSALISFLPQKKIGVVVLQNESGLRGNVLGGIIKDLVYQTLLGKTELEIQAKISKDVDWLKQSYPLALTKVQDELNHHENTVITSYSNLKNYLGEYHNPLAGKIVIYKDSEHTNHIQWGNLRGKLFGSDEKHTGLANLRPGKYYPVEFKTNNNQTLGFTINDYYFEKE
ncbi:serine hydrolase domain-containing protein [Marinicella sp. W31]|uniref:serine hydrolase domain-containing protein n=1 Tax=Marinicella sp. W31 TaxID=3023713 RepID=UPI003756DB00